MLYVNGTHIDVTMFPDNTSQVWGIPKIGCGLAGGDWNKVKKILEEVFPKEFKVKVYYLK